jgi:hypothetical protein
MANVTVFNRGDSTVLGTVGPGSPSLSGNRCNVHGGKTGRTSHLMPKSRIRGFCLHAPHQCLGTGITSCLS